MLDLTMALNKIIAISTNDELLERYTGKGNIAMRDGFLKIDHTEFDPENMFIHYVVQSKNMG